jgi:hypothetical protein
MQLTGKMASKKSEFGFEYASAALNKHVHKEALNDNKIFHHLLSGDRDLFVILISLYFKGFLCPETKAGALASLYKTAQVDNRKKTTS